MARILIVDDDEQVRASLSSLLEGSGHECQVADAPGSARTALENSAFDLVLLDVRMPEGSGLEVLRAVTADSPDTAVVMVTGADDPEMAAAALALGAFGYVLKPFSPTEIEIAVMNALRRRELERERASLLRELGETVAERTMALRIASEQLAAATGESRKHEEDAFARLQHALSIRHDETGRHVERVGHLAELLGRRLGLSGDSEGLRVAAALHDVGKIGIPDALLLKPGRLSPEELSIVQRHTQIGYRLLSDSHEGVLGMAASVALSHHERWDGEGYPRGLRGDATPLAGRITAVADAFDAMTHQRVYRPAFTEQEALAALREGRGTQFDADVVDAFLGALDEVHEVLERFPEGIEGRISLLLVDDHRMFAEALTSFLAGQEDILVVGVGGTIEEGRRLTREVRPDVVLMDFSLPDGDGVEGTALVKAEYPAAKVLMLTGSPDPDTLTRALQAGCAGYLTKGGPPGQVIEAVRQVMAGESVVPAGELAALLRGVGRTRRGLGTTITEREGEVLQLLAEGRSTEEITDRLGVSRHTVRNHIQRLIAKLDAHSRLEAVTTAVREGIVTVGATPA
ncbi:MAG TPA: response regulator [Actinomycetota bacterium]